MPARRSVLRAIGRGAAALAVVGAAGGALVAASVLPLPRVEAEPPSTVVQPAESRQLRVCPGPLLTLADDATQATDVRSAGPSTLAIAADPADAAVEQRPLEVPDDTGGGQEGAPTAISAQPGAVQAGMLAGTQSQSVDADSLRGLAVAACAEPSSDSWLVAGATDVGRAGLVLLSNPGDVTSTVDVRVVGSTGSVEAPAGLGIVVAPGTQRIVSLAGLAPNLRTPVVHVTSTGAPVAAALQHSVVLGLEPAGVELSTPVAAPAERQVVPGFSVVDRRGVDPGDDEAAGDDHPALRLYAPGGEETAAVVEVRDEQGRAVASLEVGLTAGRAIDLPLGSLAPGTYSILIQAGAPVIAAARSTVLGEGDDPIVADLAWAGSTGALLDRAVVAVPSGPGSVLWLANPTDATIAATVSTESGERIVEVPAEGGASVQAAPGGRLVLEGVEGLHAALTYRGQGALAWASVAPPGALDAPVRVFPQ
ncbi:DUF5719 family protein [Agromyces sp. SYSU T0242]|uniref:DUF5719 family protein n=1 Tax=Agromyces litoreus TaxID=3158561 RepID=UPI00339AF796